MSALTNHHKNLVEKCNISVVSSFIQSFYCFNAEDHIINCFIAVQLLRLCTDDPLKYKSKKLQADDGYKSNLLVTRLCSQPIKRKKEKNMIYPIKMVTQKVYIIIISNRSLSKRKKACKSVVDSFGLSLKLQNTNPFSARIFRCFVQNQMDENRIATKK